MNGSDVNKELLFNKIKIERDYYWKCGVCDEKPQFSTIHDLFAHKTEVHVKLYDDNELEDKLDDSSHHIDATYSNDEYDSDDHLPLSKIQEKIDNTRNQVQSQIDIVLIEQDIIEKTNSVEIEKTDTVPEINFKEDSSSRESSITEEGNNFYDLFSSSPGKFSYESVEPKIETNVSDSKYICKICHERFESRGCLTSHKKTHINPDSGKFECETCGKKCPKYDNFARHLAIHEANRPKHHKCEICSTAFYCMADLKRHASLHLEVKPFKCEQCEEGFTRQDALLAHMAKHTGVPYRKFTCTICGKILNSPSALAMHSKNHTKKSVFCKEPGCSFSCYLQSQLRQHMRIHSGEKPFQCAQCGRCFARSNDMKNHILNIHQRFRPHKCPECPKQFTLYSNLRTHKMSHAGVKPYLCAGCGKRFNHPSSLRKHAIAVHSEVEKKEELSSCQPVQNIKMVDCSTQATTDCLSLPITIHIPHISVNLPDGYPQPYIIPTVQITSPHLIKSELPSHRT